VTPKKLVLQAVADQWENKKVTPAVRFYDIPVDTFYEGDLLPFHLKVSEDSLIVKVAEVPTPGRLGGSAY
jgi:hypothetical protein